MWQLRATCAICCAGYQSRCVHAEPMGAQHWQCAAPTRLTVHLAINEGDDDHVVVQWLQPVADDEYSQAPGV
ncbi:hypothetical protein [Gordonia sp. NPDC127522]|uniref:hypothetical protein n=1 Tax=Gordonia sp. NPDC127522 TaxID=3345390 RepID=UPI0036371ADB